MAGVAGAARVVELRREGLSRSQGCLLELGRRLSDSLHHHPLPR